MNCKRPLMIWVAWLSLTLSHAALGLAQAQPVLVRRFPVDDYYASLAWLNEGRILEAQHGFETAYRVSRQVSDEHGIDSVPILIRIGQMLYLQGDLAEGLKQIETGLFLAKRCRGWTRFMQAQPIPLRGLSNEIRGIHWYNSQRDAEPGAFPDAWPVAIGYGSLIVETAPGEASSVLEVVRLDAIEVYLAQALGLRMRYQLLGTMASELSTSREILDAFPAPRADFPEVLLRCHNICHGLALIAVGDLKAAARMIQSNLEVQGSWDHPLTGVGLLALADIAILADDRPTAIRMLSESTLVFARLGQHDWLAEASERLASVSAIRRQPGSLNMLTELANWLRTRSYLSHTATLVSIAGLGAELESFSIADANATQALRKTSKYVGPLPHLQLAARFAHARILLKQGKVDAGRSALELPLKLAQGVELPGPLARPLFQLQWLGALLEASQIAPSDAAKLYDRMLDGPTPREWMYDPCESLASATANVSESGLIWLGLIARQGNSEATMNAFERLYCIRCRFQLPLAGRELDLRMLFHSESSKIPDEIKPQVLVLRKQFPSIDQTANLIQRQMETAMKVKSIDAKVWTAEEKQVWLQLGQQCDLQEQRLLEASTARVSIPTIFPPTTTIAAAKKQLAITNSDETRAILGFFVTSQSLHGYWISKERAELWSVDRAMLANNKARQLRDSIGVGQSPTKVLASVKKPAWRSPAKELQSLLIPANVVTQLANINHLTIIPDDWLWYVPFELFPDTLANASQPWLARHSITYAPTLGIALTSFSDSPSSKRTLGVTRSGFFVADKEIDSGLVRGLVDSVDGTQLVDTQSKIHASRWSRLQFDQVWVASNTTLEYGTPFALMAYDAGGTTSLRQWLQLPSVAPTQLALVGNDVPAMARNNSNGAELFQLACYLAAMGNRSAVVNRWNPRGESTQLLLKNFLELSTEIPAAQAWRRSVLSLWETPLQYPTEPILGTLKKDFFQDEFTGSHPIFWAGAMTIGNTQPIKTP